MRLNCILQDLFRDTPLDHIRRAQICAKKAYLAIFDIFGRVFERAKYGEVGGGKSKIGFFCLPNEHKSHNLGRIQCELVECLIIETM